MSGDTTILEMMKSLAQVIVTQDSNLHIVSKKSAATKDAETRCFLAYNGHALGRDFNVYDLKASLSTEQAFVLPEIYQNVVAPLAKKSPQAFNAALTFFLEDSTIKFKNPETQQAWLSNIEKAKLNLA